MKKEKWILNEISMWQNENLIDEEAAAKLRKRYEKATGVGFITVLFAIIGSALIGAGIILISGKNWYRLPFIVRAAIAFLPLIVSHAASVFVLKKKYESLAWREAVAILNTAAVFSSVALVGQVFHLAGDYGAYILTCGLLSLPIVYILNASSPLIVYYWAVLNWAPITLESGELSAVVLFALFALGALFNLYIYKEKGPRADYVTWITAIGGFFAVLFMGILSETSLLLMCLSYFLLLFCSAGFCEKTQKPFGFIGTVGILVLLAILTYEGMWSYLPDGSYVVGILLVVAFMTGSFVIALRSFKENRLKFFVTMSVLLLCAIRIAALFVEIDASVYPVIFSLLANVLLLVIGVGYIVSGAKNVDLVEVNAGMLTVCTLAVMRFFDSDMDFLWRGIVFLVLGTGFLLANLKMLRVKKKKQSEVAS